MISSETSALAAELAAFGHACPEHDEDVAHFLSLLEGDENPFLRENLVGHFTGSAWLVNGSGTHVLLTHHRKLNRWLQLGGHADGDTLLSRVALREAEEESGLSGLQLVPGIFDLDCHLIPARHAEPAHFHFDVRYVVRTSGNEAFAASEESHALAWRDIREIAADPVLDESLRRMARRWLSLP
ncbi:MAG: NUDIX hydrolase [Lysobacteraceae bacterium]